MRLPAPAAYDAVLVVPVRAAAGCVRSRVHCYVLPPPAAYDGLVRTRYVLPCPHCQWASMSRRLGVVWSDGNTLVLNKPSGLAVQDIAVRLNRILRRKPTEPVWLPHRIDKYTRGLQVVTVCKEACSALNRSSEQRRWRKRYRALTCIPSGSDAERSPLIREDGSLVPEGWLVSGMLRRQLRPGAILQQRFPARVHTRFSICFYSLKACYLLAWKQLHTRCSIRMFPTTCSSMRVSCGWSNQPRSHALKSKAISMLAVTGQVQSVASGAIGACGHVHTSVSQLFQRAKDLQRMKSACPLEGRIRSECTSPLLTFRSQTTSTTISHRTSLRKPFDSERRQYSVKIAGQLAVAYQYPPLPNRG